LLSEWNQYPQVIAMINTRAPARGAATLNEILELKIMAKVFPNTLAGLATFSEAAGKTVFRRCLRGGADCGMPNPKRFL
jgi:hypothetical protein